MLIFDDRNSQFFPLIVISFLLILISTIFVQHHLHIIRSGVAVMESAAERDAGDHIRRERMAENRIQDALDRITRDILASGFLPPSGYDVPRVDGIPVLKHRRTVILPPSNGEILHGIESYVEYLTGARCLWRSSRWVCRQGDIHVVVDGKQTWVTLMLLRATGSLLANITSDMNSIPEYLLWDYLQRTDLIPAPPGGFLGLDSCNITEIDAVKSINSTVVDIIRAVSYMLESSINRNITSADVRVVPHLEDLNFSYNLSVIRKRYPLIGENRCLILYRAAYRIGLPLEFQIGYRGRYASFIYDLYLDTDDNPEDILPEQVEPEECSGRCSLKILNTRNYSMRTPWGCRLEEGLNRVPCSLKTLWIRGNNGRVFHIEVKANTEIDMEKYRLVEFLGRVYLNRSGRIDIIRPVAGDPGATINIYLFSLERNSTQHGEIDADGRFLFHTVPGAYLVYLEPTRSKRGNPLIPAASHMEHLVIDRDIRRDFVLEGID